LRRWAMRITQKGGVGSAVLGMLIGRQGQWRKSSKRETGSPETIWGITRPEGADLTEIKLPEPRWRLKACEGCSGGCWQRQELGSGLWILNSCLVSRGCRKGRALPVRRLPRGAVGWRQQQRPGSKCRWGAAGGAGGAGRPVPVAGFVAVLSSAERQSREEDLITRR